MLITALIAGRAGKVDQTLLIILGIVGLATWPISGHPSASPVPTLTVVADVAHLASMSVWLGGLVMLFVYLLPKANDRELAAIGLGQVFRLPSAGAKLQRDVAVLVHGAVGHDLALGKAQHRHRHVLASVGKDAGHADLLCDHPGTHVDIPYLFRLRA